MGAAGAVFGVLFLLCLAAGVWRLVTLPARLGRSAQRLSNAVQQRQADKAAGKAVAPVSVLAIAGLALAIVGVIVARTTDAILGLGMVVVGMGLILVGAQMAKARQNSTSQGGPYPQSWWSPDQGGYGPPPTIDSTIQNPSAHVGHAPEDSTSPLLPVRPPQQSTASASEGRPSRSVSPPVPNAAHPRSEGAFGTSVIPAPGNVRRTHATHSATPIPLASDPWVGGMAQVISGDKRVAGRIGQVVSLSGQDVELKFKGTFGSLSFRRKDVIAVTAQMADIPRAGIVTHGRLIPGAMATVVSGDPRYNGRVGRVVIVDGGMTTLRLKGALGDLDFRTTDVAAV